MIRYILFAILAWFLYNLVFRFIIPVYRTSKQMRNKFQEMQQQMHQKMQEQHQGYQPQSAPKPNPPQVSGDYIEFEEVK